MNHSANIRILISMLFVGALAALGAWIAYVAKFSRADEGSTQQDTEYQRAMISFQALVASILLYFAGHHGFDMMMNYVKKV